MGIKTFTAQMDDGSRKNVSLLDADAWRSIFPEWFSGGHNLDLVSLWRQQSFLKAAVNLRASAVADIPWEVYSRNNTDGEPIVTHEDNDPPEDMPYVRGMSRMLHEIEASIALLGRAHRLIEQERGQPGMLSLLPAQQMKPIVSRFNGITGWKRIPPNGQEIRYQNDDLVSILAPDAFTDTSKGGDGLAARNDADVLYALGQFLNNYLDRGMIKGTILTVEGTVDPDERNRLEKWWNRWFSGTQSAGNQKVMNAAVEPVVVGEGLSDLSNTELEMRAREAIATALKTPHSLVLSNASNFATAQADQLNFYQFCVLPEARLIENGLNDQFFHARDLHFSFDPSKLEVLQRYELEKAEAVQRLTGRPVLTVDEARELIGYDPMPEDAEAMPVSGDGQMGQPPQTVPGRNDLSDEAEAEVRKWKKKASRHGRDASFEAHHIPREVTKTIRQRLDVGEPVESAFDPPYHF